MREASVYFLPSARSRALLTTRRWEALLEKVRGGATLFLAWDDTYLTRLNEVCGVEVVSRRETQGTMTYEFDGFSLTLPRPVRVVFRSRGAEVLAHDAEGNPCFSATGMEKERFIRSVFRWSVCSTTPPGFMTAMHGRFMRKSVRKNSWRLPVRRSSPGPNIILTTVKRRFCLSTTA